MNKDTRIGLICRLCGKEEKYLIDIFSDDGRKQDLEKKIRLCLPITVTSEDEMPRQVCLDCLNKLDATFELYTGCIAAQHYIRQKLGHMQRSVPVVPCNGTLQSGFLSDSNTVTSRRGVADNSLRNFLGLQRTFSSFVDIEQKRHDDEDLQKMVAAHKGIMQQPGIQYANNSTQYMNNMPAQVNSSSSNGQLLGTHMNGTNVMLTAANIPMMQATNSPMAGNIQSQMYVSPLANAMNPSVSVSSASVPVMANPQSMLGSSTHMTISCNQPQYSAQNNLPASLQIMPATQVQASSSDRPSTHFTPATSIFQAQPSPILQNGGPLSRNVGLDGHMQPMSSNNMSYRRLLGEPSSTRMVNSGTPSVIPTSVAASNLFNHIPASTISMPVVSTANNTPRMQSPAGTLSQQQSIGNFMHQTVSLWMNKQTSASKTMSFSQSVDGSQTAMHSISVPRSELQTTESGSTTVPMQPVITQVTSGYQSAGPVQPSQDASVHLDLSNDADDDVDTTMGMGDASDAESENVKPFALSTPSGPQRKLQRKRNVNSSSMETCPHCHKEFRADIIFHHIKLHFRQSFFSCLDCGRNYSSEKALEAHKCPGEVG